MDGAAIWHQFGARGIAIWDDGENLKVAGELDDATAAEIKDAKPALLAFLRAETVIPYTEADLSEFDALIERYCSLTRASEERRLELRHERRSMAPRDVMTRLERIRSKVEDKERLAHPGEPTGILSGSPEKVSA